MFHDAAADDIGDIDDDCDDDNDDDDDDGDDDDIGDNVDDDDDVDDLRMRILMVIMMIMMMIMMTIYRRQLQQQHLRHDLIFTNELEQVKQMNSKLYAQNYVFIKKIKNKKKSKQI